ncbi:MAG: ferritin-like domain-containing protein [Ginsengibacter sp.]
MAQITDLKDLLKHEILDLYSAEEQIIDSLPKMIEKANNAQLKGALNDHLKVTELQKARLEDIKGLMSEKQENDSKEKKGFFSKLFGGSGGEKCKGTEGLIKEGEKMMREDMTPGVMDAAIIGAAQKIEHYEISGYGTALAYARQLNLSNVAVLLQQTLDEEYAADDSLTKLAVSKLNTEAENVTSSSSKGRSQKSVTLNSNQKLTSHKSVSHTNTSKTGPSKTGSSKTSKSSGNKSAVQSTSKTASKSGKSLSAGKSKTGKSKSSSKKR